MRKVSRMLLLACAGLAALAITGSALAAYSPRMVVAGSNHATGGGGPVTFNISQADTDDFTAVMTLYSPLGYDAALNATTGQQIGTASARVKLHAFGGATVPVTGTVNADDPTKAIYTDPRQNLCSPGRHAAVWTITVTLAGHRGHGADLRRPDHDGPRGRVRVDPDPRLLQQPERQGAQPDRRSAPERGVLGGRVHEPEHRRRLPLGRACSRRTAPRELRTRPARSRLRRSSACRCS